MSDVDGVVCLVRHMVAGAATVVCLVRHRVAGATMGFHYLVMFGMIAGCIRLSGLVDSLVVMPDACST